VELAELDPAARRMPAPTVSMALTELVALMRLAAPTVQTAALAA